MSPSENIKDLQVKTCLHLPVESSRTAGFEAWELVGDLPDFSFADLDTSVTFLGRRLTIPLIISSMTGGGKDSLRLNRRLAEAAQETGIGMGVGSQHVMLEDCAATRSFQVRTWAPDVLLLANLGLVRLGEGVDEDACVRAVEEIEADGLILYINPMHEALQANGELEFSGLLAKLGALASTFPYPLLVKEVGFGLDEPLLRRLAVLPLAGVDVAGAGGTNWGRVEAFLTGSDPNPLIEELGVPTAVSLEAAVRLLPSSTAIISSGGIRTGLDIAKSVALGARLAGAALPFLRRAEISTGQVVELISAIERQLRLSLWYSGAQTIAAMRGRIRRLDTTCSPILA